jgi:hypothetical protein
MSVKSPEKKFVLPTFEPLPYPLSPIPSKIQDSELVGDVYHIEKTLWNNEKEFTKVVDLQKLLDESGKSLQDIAYVYNIPDQDFSDNKSLKSSIDVRIQSVLDFKILNEYNLTTQVSYSGIKACKLDIVEYSNLISETDLKKRIDQFTAIKTNGRTDKIYLLVGSIKISNLKISFSSTNNSDVSFALNEALTKGLVKAAIDLNLDETRKSLVSGSEMFVAIDKDEIAYYLPSKRHP